MADTVDPDPPPPPPPVEPPAAVTVTQPVNQPTTPIPADAPPPRQGCMAKRSCLEKCLLVFIIIILIICILFVAYFLITYFFSSSPEIAGTCLSTKCVNSASRLRSYMDEEADPCSNFYDYACGGWMKSTVLEPHEDRVDLRTTIKDSYNVKMKGLLEVEADLDDPPYVEKSKTFYKSCMDIERLNERGVQPFVEFVEEIGKFPTLDSTWNQTVFDLSSVAIPLAKIGVTPLFSIYVDKDILEPDTQRLYFGDAKLSFPDRSVYKNGRKSPDMKNREKWLVDVLVMLGADKDLAKSDASAVLDFDIELSKLTRDPAEEEKTPEPIDALKSKYPWLDWTQLYKELGIDLEERVIVREPTYLEKLTELLDESEDRVVANYLMFNLLKFTAWLGEDFINRLAEYIELTEAKTPLGRWEQCINQVTAVFPMAVSRMFVDKHFPEESKDEMTTIAKDLTAAFSSMLGDVTWMTDKTKKKAKAKLALLEQKIGYPEDLMDEERLNNLYEDITATEYLEMMAEFRAARTAKEMLQVGQRHDRKRWKRNFPASVDAGYNVFENEIIFPAAFMQPPVYKPEYTSSMKYGGAGTWFARHLVEGFGKRGSNYDGQGELNPWWEDEDKENFEEQTTCFVDQYGCYKWEGNSINGELTLADNIADNGGLKQSYLAYRNSIQREGVEEMRLPGLDLDHNQIFFLSFAQTYCAQIRDDAKREIVDTGPHSPHPYRVYGALQNSKEFAEAFSCPLGSRMNPMRKCVMW